MLPLGEGCKDVCVMDLYCCSVSSRIEDDAMVCGL